MKSKCAVGVLIFTVAFCCYVETGCGSGNAAASPSNNSNTASTPSGSSNQTATSNNTGSNVPVNSGGTPQPTFALVPYFNGGVYGYALDANTGALTPTSSVVSGPSPTAIAVHPSQSYVYVGNAEGRSGPPGTITAFSVAPDGTLTPLLNSTVTVNVDPDLEVLAMHPSGKYLYVATNQGVASLNIDPNTGLLSQPVLRVANAAVRYPMAIDSTGKYLFTIFASSSSSPSSIAVYGISQSDGSLTLLSSTLPAASLSSMSILSSGNFLYVANSYHFGNTIAAYAVDPATGALTAVKGSPFATGTFPGPLAVGLSGKLLFAVTANVNGELGNFWVYAVDQNTGVLSPVGPPQSIDSPVTVGVDPSGKFVYVSSAIVSENNSAGFITGWMIDPTSLQLTLIQGSPFPSTGLSPGAMAFVQPPQ